MVWFGIALTFGGALGLSQKLRIVEGQRPIRIVFRLHSALFAFAGTALLTRGAAGLAGIA